MLKINFNEYWYSIIYFSNLLILFIISIFRSIRPFQWIFIIMIIINHTSIFFCYYTLYTIKRSYILLKINFNEYWFSSIFQNHQFNSLIHYSDGKYTNQFQWILIYKYIYYIVIYTFFLLSSFFLQKYILEIKPMIALI